MLPTKADLLKSLYSSINKSLSKFALPKNVNCFLEHPVVNQVWLLLHLPVYLLYHILLYRVNLLKTNVLQQSVYLKSWGRKYHVIDM